MRLEGRELVEDELGGVVVRELGSYHLKDIDRPERLYQLDIEGLQTQFPPLRAAKVAEPRKVSRRSLLVAALAGVLAAAVAIPIFAFGQGGGGGGSIEAAAGNSVAFVDADSGRLVADVAVGTTPTDVVVAEGALWVTNTGDGTVDRIDLTTRTVRQTIRVGLGPIGIAFGDGSIWVANGAAGSNAETDTIRVGNGPGGIAFGQGSVWVANRDSHTVSRIDPAAGRVARTVAVGLEPLDVAVGPEGVWATSSEGRVVRIDPSSGSVVDTVGVGRRPTGIAVGLGSVWVSNSFDGTVSRIDAQTAAVRATIEAGEGPAGIAVSGEAIWVASEEAGTLTRIDPESNDVARSITIGGTPVAVTVAPNGVFVAVRPSGVAHRGGVLTVFHFERTPGSLDPAASFTVFAGMGLTSDGLTGWKRVAGQEGTQLVPNLSTAIPEPTEGGRTYTFRVRKGVRYSSGELLRASDFRRAFERLFALNPLEAGFYSAIPGAAACQRKPQACDLSRNIVANDAAGTITFRLARPDPDFPAKLAFPPASATAPSAPMTRLARRPLPATGPYMIGSYVPGSQLRLVRNPHFRVWSRAARPDGHPDEIVVKLGVPPEAQIAAVAGGRADVSDLTFSELGTVNRLRSRYGNRIHSDPGPVVFGVFLNTSRAPFDDERVRRALNLAVDRDVVVKTFGGALRAAPTCQLLPPNYAAYESYCPYERDLDEAKRLVAASGTRGQEVVVWTRVSLVPEFRHVVEALETLGYRARLRPVPDADYYPKLPRDVQAGYIGWAAAIPSAAEYMQSLLDFLSGYAGFSDRTITRAVQRALRLQQTDVRASNEVWTRVDRLLVDGAYLVPIFNGHLLSFISDRVRNYQVHPFYYFLVDQFWVR
jgi:peptide/nickel transport system substrate-binding protein